MTDIIEELKDVKHWRSGVFIDGPEYSRMSEEWKKEQINRERLLLRPSAEGNAICQTSDSRVTNWLADRLNSVHKLEEEIEKLRQERDDYKEAYEDTKRLARMIDVAMCGVEGAATQASLCDLVGVAENLKKENDRMRKVLRKCGKQFSYYAELHRGKGTEEGRVKGNTNAMFAFECKDVIGEV